MDKRRHAIAAVAALLQNANFKGFFTGNIYQGPLKKVCVPGLNCYSCPGAVGACPIGSLQAHLATKPLKFPYYIVGLLLFFGALLGRAVCGFLCPFGLLQELIHKIPFFKKVRTFRGDRPLRYVKYVVLLVLVVLLPTVNMLIPYFCKYVCPSGTLSGILLRLSDSRLGQMFGALFQWKFAILAAVLLLSLMLWRPFCKYLCPLGAFYGLCSRVSLVRMTLDAEKCVHCGACAKVCGMAIDPARELNSAECIQCGRCQSVCPEKAIARGPRLGKAGREKVS